MQKLGRLQTVKKKLWVRIRPIHYDNYDAEKRFSHSQTFPSQAGYHAHIRISDGLRLALILAPLKSGFLSPASIGRKKDVLKN